MVVVYRLSAIKKVSGTKAAVVPIRVPTIALVTGSINTSNMIKGMERTVFITKLRVLNTNLFSLSPPLAVRTRVKAKIIPIREPNTKDTNTI